MKSIRLTALLICLILIACDDSSNSGLDNNEPVSQLEEGRYDTTYTQDVTITRSVKYGESMTQGGVNMDLTFDFYEPYQDSALSRPLVIYAHDGGFYTGSKEEKTEFAMFLAESGYAVACIDYRLIDVELTPISVTIANADALFDLKAAVRYFYKDAQIDNQFKIDTNNIFLSGFSAGAFMCLNYAYWNTDEETINAGTELLLSYVESQGGYSGNSGNEGYSENINSIINIAGALFDVNFIDDENTPIFSVHGDADMVVPYERGISDNSGVETSGSKLIHERANEVGIENELITISGGDHGDAYYNDENYPLIRKFIYDKMK